MRFLRRGEAASSLDLLVAGLGNPGREYARTRHNVGFLVVDELARRHAGSFRGKFTGELAEVRVEGRRVALLKPQTFMNLSGRSVGAALRFFKLPPEQLLVVHDEVDLELGRLQARLGGGLAGHNGLRSLGEQLGTRSSCAFGSASGAPSAATRARSPTGCSRPSTSTLTSSPSWHAPRTRSRPWPSRPSRSLSSGSTSVRKGHVRGLTPDMSQGATRRAGEVPPAPDGAGAECGSPRSARARRGPAPRRPYSTRSASGGTKASASACSSLPARKGACGVRRVERRDDPRPPSARDQVTRHGTSLDS